MPGRLEFEFQVKNKKPTATATGGSTLRVLVLGDFSGRRAQGALEAGAALGARALHAVDLDSFDQVMTRLAPAVTLPVGGAGGEAGGRFALPLATLEAFHPDQLVSLLPALQPLRALRQRLLDPRTSGETIEALIRAAGGALGSPPPAPAPGGATPTAPASSSSSSTEGEGATLERLLGRRPATSSATGTAAAPTSTVATEVARLIGQAVAPHVKAAADPRQATLVASVEAAMAAHLRAALHDPSFQALEASWRGIEWLVAATGPGKDLKIVLLDVAKEEIALELSSGGDPGASALGRRILSGAGDAAWSLIVGNYTFGGSGEDAAVLSGLGAIAAQAGAPLLAGADGRVLGCPSPAERPDPTDWGSIDAAAAARWQALRASPHARFIGLVWPRFLLRLPYGPKTDRVESFPFVELPPGPAAHEAYLWGNPAFLCASLTATAFRENEAFTLPEAQQEIDDLPLHTFQADGESTVKPCAEGWLSERAAAAALTRGIMPVLSRRDRNAVQVVRFQSIADPPAALAGPWES